MADAALGGATWGRYSTTLAPVLQQQDNAGAVRFSGHYLWDLPLFISS